MAADQEVLREFLVSLGFKIDEAGQKKFTKSLDTSTKGALAVGGALIGAAWAVEQFVEKMTEGLSKLYYASQRTGATVAGIKETQSAFEAVGLTADDANKSLEAIGKTLRYPWMRQFMGGALNIDVSEGRKTEDIERDAMHSLAAMYKNEGTRAIATGYAQQFAGLDETGLQNIANNLEAYDKMQQAVTQRMTEGGVSLEANAKDAAEFQRQLKLIGQDFSVLANEVLPHLMPEVHSLANDFEDFLHALIKTNAEMPKATSIWKQLWQSITGQAVTQFESESSTPSSTGDAELDAYYKAHPDKKPVHQATLSTDDYRKMALEAARKYGIDPDEFAAQMQLESGFNPNAVNGSHVGIAQFSKTTAHDRGFEAGADPQRDLAEAARLISELIGRTGSQREATRWYNQGTSVGPQTAQAAADANAYADRIQAIKHMTVAPVTNITVNGAGQPQDTAQSVASVVRQQNNELMRNSLGMFSPGG